MPRRASIDSQALSDLARRQHNCVTLKQLTELGMPSSTVAHRTRARGGVWQRILPGVVLLHNGTPTEPERVSAALLYAGPGAVVTGAAALRRHGLRKIPPSDRIEIIIPIGRHRTSTGFVLVERSKRTTSVDIGGLPYAPVARAVVDHCRRLTDLTAVRALSAEAVQRRLCPLSALTEEIRRAQRRGTVRIREALAGVVAGVRSALEAEFRELVQRAGLPEPAYNVDLTTPEGRFVAAPDGWYAWAGVAVEVDSREWHLDPDSWEATQSRRSRLAAYGVTVIAVTYRRMRDNPDELISELRQALDTGKQRPDLPLVAVRRSQAA